MKSFISGLILLFSALTCSGQLDITKINDSVFVYTTYMDFGGEPFPSNSMCILTDDGVLMLDTPWDSTQLEPLFDTIRKMWNSRPVELISTHFHLDRTAGIHWLEGHGVKTHGTRATRMLCVENEQTAPFYEIEPRAFHIANVEIDIFYPGPGHAPDNIVIYIPKWKLLYGGCFVKSTESSDLGNLSHADPKKWLKAARKTRKRYAEAEIVITGHQAWKGLESLDYTIQLLEEYLKK